MTSWTEGYVADIGYTLGYYRELSPSLHRFALLLRGIRPPNLERGFAFAELGCGQGVSTLIHAACDPHGSYFANDFNPSQIAGAQQRARDGGVSNLKLADDSFAEYLDADLPPLDAIALHGVYSWISDERRREIVQFIRRNLKPGGYVYISYNALPGWAHAMPMREAMVRAAPAGASLSRIGVGLDFVRRLQEVGAKYMVANPNIAERLKAIGGQPPAYVAHEYFNRDWRPMYHADVVEQLEHAKLVFAAPANVVEGIDSMCLTAAQIELLGSVADPVWRETARDYCMNQQFRRDIFVRGDVRLSATDRGQALREIRFALNTPRSMVKDKVRVPVGEAELRPAAYGPVLDMLVERPATLEELWRGMGNDIPFPVAVEAITMLVGSGFVDPCLPASGDKDRRRSTDRLNAMLLDRSFQGDEIAVLASPITGLGIPLNRIQRLFLLAQKRKATDLTAFAYDALVKSGQKLLKDGVAVEGSDETLQQLRGIEREFVSETVVVLRNLGIA